MVNLRHFMQSSFTFIPRRFLLFLAVFLISFHQAIILTYGFFGKEAIAANIEQLNDAFVPNSFVLSYIWQLGIGRIVLRLAAYTIPLFLVQSIPTFLYIHFNSVKGRRATALAIWLLPALLGLPTLLITAAYLLSPLYAIHTLPGFMFLDTTGQTHKEDFAEGLIFKIAAIGWFHIFWLAMTIKAWFFPKQRFHTTV